MEKIGHKETKWLFFLLMISNALTGGIKMITEEFAAGGYICIALSLVFTLLLLWVTDKCLEGNDLWSAKPKSPLGLIWPILSLGLFCLTVIKAGTEMKFFAKAIADTVLLQSPSVFILILMALAAFAVMLLKLEALTRYSLAASTVFLVFLGIIALTTISETDITNIYPLMGKENFFNLWQGLYLFTDVIYFYIISSHIKDYSKSRRVPYKSVLLAGIAAEIVFVMYSLCVPYPVSRSFKYPLYRLAVLANSSVVFQRLDGLVFLIWIFLGFISSGALALFAVMIFKKTFGLKNQNAICPAVVFLCFAVSLWDADFSELIKISMTVSSFLILPVWAVMCKFRKGWKKRCLKK